MNTLLVDAKDVDIFFSEGHDECFSAAVRASRMTYITDAPFGSSSSQPAEILNFHTKDILKESRWHRQVHRAQCRHMCRHTDEEEDHPR